MMPRRWERRLRYWLHSGERARLLREEMKAHLEMMVAEMVEDGMTEQEARNAARRQFGNSTLLQEESRQMWIARWLNDLVQDAVFAVRAIRKQPGFAAAAVLSAALGVGACSTVFGLANFALFRELPINDPSGLMSIAPQNMRSGKAGQRISYPDFEDLRQARSFEGVTAFVPSVSAAISGGAEPQRYWGSVVTANFFDVVRPPFIAGRGFDASRDDRPGEPPAVVLSHQLWRTRFAGDTSLLGQTIELNRRKVTVIGITGHGFRGTEPVFFSDFWLPFSTLDALDNTGISRENLRNRGSQWLMAVGRLRPGVSVKAAAVEVELIGKRLSAAYPEANKDRVFRTERAGQLNPGLRKLMRVVFLMLVVVAALVLCTACANVANLLLARASARRKEIATRLAIGAGRGRLVRQLLTESSMLALAGGAAGYAIAYLGTSALATSRLPLSLPLDLNIPLDYRVVLFSTALSVFTGVLFGLAPALRATRPNLTGALRGDSEPIGRLRRFGMRNLLVVAQVAICMVLLICSGLFLRSFQSAQSTDVGFTHRNLLLMAFDPSLNHTAQDDTRRVTDQLLESIRSLPGVQSASIGDRVPLNLERTQNTFSREDAAADRERGLIKADIYAIAPDYFTTLGVRFIDGEDFRPGVPADDIAIINRAAAEKAFPRENPIGRLISYQGRTVRITGVVETTKSCTIGEDARPSLYFPMAREMRDNTPLNGMTLLVRTQGDPAGYTRTTLETLRRIDPSLAIYDIRTMDTQISRALFLPRATAVLFGLTGAIGLLIAGIGLYGVISFTVAKRTGEIGIRMALGATRTRVAGLVLRQGLVLTAIGSAIGLAISLAASRAAASLLYGVSPTDTLTFVAVPAFLLLIAAGACLAPARRAASLDPLRALRCE